MRARGIGVRASKRKRVYTRALSLSLAHTLTRVYGRESAGKATPDHRKRARERKRERGRVSKEKESGRVIKKNERKREKESERGPERKRVEDRTPR